MGRTCSRRWTRSGSTAPRSSEAPSAAPSRCAWRSWRPSASARSRSCRLRRPASSRPRSCSRHGKPRRPRWSAATSRARSKRSSPRGCCPTRRPSCASASRSRSAARSPSRRIADEVPEAPDPLDDDAAALAPHHDPGARAGRRARHGGLPRVRRGVRAASVLRRRHHDRRAPGTSRRSSGPMPSCRRCWGSSAGGRTAAARAEFAPGGARVARALSLRRRRMPLIDFLTGSILFALMLLGVSVATALIVRRRLAHLDRLERALAAIVAGTAILILVHLVPLLLGILHEATVLAASALAAGLATRVRPAAAHDQARPIDAREPPPPSGRLDWAVAALASFVVLVAAVADLRRWAANEIVGVDPLTFHLPNIGRWIQTGSLWQIDQFVPLLAHGNYPNTGDVVLLSTVLPWHNDFLVRAPICFFLAVTAVAVAALARELRAPAAASVLAAAALLAVPIVGLATIPRALPDSLLWATFTIGALFLARHARTGLRSDLLLAAVALSIAFGTKWYGLSSVAVLVAIWTAARLLDTRRPERARAARRGARRRDRRGRRPRVDGAQHRRVLQPVLPREDRRLRGDDLRRAARRDRRGRRLQHPRLPRRPAGARQLAGEVFDGLGVLAIVCVVGPRGGGDRQPPPGRASRRVAVDRRRRARAGVRRAARNRARQPRRPVAGERQHALRDPGAAARGAGARVGARSPAARRDDPVRARDPRRRRRRRAQRLRGARRARHRARGGRRRRCWPRPAGRCGAYATGGRSCWRSRRSRRC